MFHSILISKGLSPSSHIVLHRGSSTFRWRREDKLTSLSVWRHRAEPLHSLGLVCEMGPSSQSGQVLSPSHWTTANRSSDDRRWEVYRNDGASKKPRSLHWLVLQAIATMWGGIWSCPSFLLHEASRICSTYISNLLTSVLGHGSCSFRLCSTGICPLSPEEHQVDWSYVNNCNKMREE